VSAFVRSRSRGRAQWCGIGKVAEPPASLRRRRLAVLRQATYCGLLPACSSRRVVYTSYGYTKRDATRCTAADWGTPWPSMSSLAGFAFPSPGPFGMCGRTSAPSERTLTAACDDVPAPTRWTRLPDTGKEVPVTSPGDQPEPGAGGASSEARSVPLSEATRTWFSISLQTFGGPAGQIAVMQHALVDQKRWIGQKRFLHAPFLLHFAAGARSPAIGHLHRMAAQRDGRWPDRRSPVRAPRSGGPAGVVQALRERRGHHDRHRRARCCGPSRTGDRRPGRRACGRSSPGAPSTGSARRGRVRRLAGSRPAR